MNTSELLDYHQAFCNKAREIMARKNNDYAGSSGVTPFSNFEITEQLGITSTEKGFLVRIVDKIKRLVTFANDGKLAVVNESADDACMDIVNYAILMSAYMLDKRVRQAKEEIERVKHNE